MGGPRPRLPYVDPLGPGSSGMAGRFTRGRAPSLGELHQELEQENEAQVVRWDFNDLPDRANSVLFAESSTFLDH